MGGTPEQRSVGAGLDQAGERRRRMVTSPKGRRRVLVSSILAVATAIGVVFWVELKGVPSPPPSPAQTSSPLRVPGLRASPSVTTLYLLPVPEGSRLIEHHNVNEVEPGKIQASFEEDALESYEVDAPQDAIASFFHHHLERQGWDQDSTVIAGDAAPTLSYSMRQYSWAVEIVIEGGEPSDLSTFHVRGRKQ